MILYRPSNGMGKLRPILADIAHETRLADHRWRIAHITGVFFLVALQQYWQSKPCSQR